MRRTLFVILLSTLWAIPLNTRATIFQAGVTDKPCYIQKIYVAEFGSDPRFINFRLDLQKWLSKKKFTIVDKPDEAEAVLTGTLSITNGEKRSNLTLKNAALTTARGERVWHADYDLTTKNSFAGLGRGHIENAAIRIAKDIRAACK